MPNPPPLPHTPQAFRYTIEPRPPAMCVRASCDPCLFVGACSGAKLWHALRRTYEEQSRQQSQSLSETQQQYREQMEALNATVKKRDETIARQVPVYSFAPDPAHNVAYNIPRRESFAESTRGGLRCNP